MFDPRGAIVRRMRDTVRETYDDGSESTRTVTGAGIIVRVHPTAESRRTFARRCRQLGVIPTDVDADSDGRSASYVENDGTFDRRTGARRRPEDVKPTTFQVVGAGPALLALTQSPAVAGWHAAVAVWVPVVAGGAGPEKARPASGTRFGKPGTVAATAAALRVQRERERQAQLRATAE